MDTTALRVLAIFLIANSHLEDLYPFRQLAADGLLGNSLFFMLSGLGIALSPRTGNARLVEWYGRRLSRIYPGLWLTVLVGIVMLQGAWRDWTPIDFVNNLVWPTPYGFLAQIVLFYPAFFLIKALSSARIELGVMLALIASYLTVAVIHYDLHVLSWILDFQMMLLGGLLATKVKEMGSHGHRHLLVLTLTMLIYVGVKLGMTIGRIPTHIAVLHVLIVPVVFSLLGLCATVTVQNLSRLPWLKPVLALVGGLTLEVYLVHGFVYKNHLVATLPFPINLVAFWAVTLPLAWVLSLAADRARQFVRSGPKLPDFLLRPPVFSPKNRLITAACDTTRGEENPA